MVHLAKNGTSGHVCPDTWPEVMCLSNWGLAGSIWGSETSVQVCTDTSQFANAWSKAPQGVIRCLSSGHYMPILPSSPTIHEYIHAWCHRDCCWTYMLRFAIVTNVHEGTTVCFKFKRTITSYVTNFLLWTHLDMLPCRVVVSVLYSSYSHSKHTIVTICSSLSSTSVVVHMHWDELLYHSYFCRPFTDLP